MRLNAQVKSDIWVSGMDRTRELFSRLSSQPLNSKA